jgi:DNA-binding NarL/FixJ family response regulator
MLALRARGKSLKVIAAELATSPATVTRELRRAMAQLGARTTAELAAIFAASADAVRVERSARAGSDAVPHALEAQLLKKSGRPYLVLSFPLVRFRVPRGLTDAEKSVLGLLLRGHSNAAIAKHRATSQRTVANQVASIFRKLGVSSRAELAATLAGAPQVPFQIKA